MMKSDPPQAICRLRVGKHWRSEQSLKDQLNLTRLCPYVYMTGLVDSFNGQTVLSASPPASCLSIVAAPRVCVLTAVFAY